MSERDDNADQPPGVDVHADSKMYPPANEAAERILEFVVWFGDGDISEYFPAWPPLYARDLEAVCKSFQGLAKRQGRWTGK